MIALENITLVKEMIEKAEGNLRAAKQLLSNTSSKSSLTKIKSASKKSKKKEPTFDESSAESNIVEGSFDGQQMVNNEGKTYPVPANYASKSKLVKGDKLKLTIQEDGSYIYKQTGPAERDHVVGPLTYEDGLYKVLANGKSYNVLLASVTYYKADIGDKVAIIIPKNEESEWGAIDHVLPKEIDIETHSSEKELF